MLMKLISCSGKTKNLAEYRKKLEQRCLMLRVVTVLGALSVLLANLWPKSAMADGQWGDFFRGFYTGTGMALLILGALLERRTRKLLADEAALKQERLENEDERRQEIANRALRTAGFLTFVALYIALLMAGLVYPPLFFFCMAAILFYLLCMAGALFYYNRTL